MDSSLRPKARKAEPLFNNMNYRQYMEYIADEVKNNPIAQLGVDPNVMSMIMKPQGPLSKDYREFLEGRGSPIKNAFYNYIDENEDYVDIGEDLKEGKAVQAHEFTHRGFRLLKNYYDEDPEYFVKKYGQGAANIVKDIDTPEGHRRHEFDTEMYDNREAVFETPSGPMKYSEHFEGNNETVDKFQRYRSLLGPRVEKTRFNKLDKFLFDAFQQLERAAGDMINKRKGYVSGGSVESSLRPRSRPIKDQTEEMLRPKSRLDAQREKEKRQLQMKTFGDLEYRADLDKQLSWNPIARLGYNPDAHKVFKQREPKTGLAFQGGGPRTIKKLKELGYEGAEKAQQGSVITTTNYSFSPVISHEFTHIGFDILKKRRNKDPEAFDKKYGEDAGRILKLTESGKLKEEYYIEFFDDLNTRFNTDMLPKDFKEFPKSTIRDTVQSYPSGPAVSIADRGEEKRNKRVAEIKKFQNVDLKRKEKGKESLYLDRIDKGILGLMDAAQDILTEQGEPPKAKMKTLSFWEKVGKSFSNLKPVGTRGLYKGGLSAQTEGAFKQPKKGLSYGELIIDNILGLDNEYESFGEKLGKAINEDEINFLKNAAVGVYEGAKEFVTSPVETTKKVVTDIKNSVQRLGTEDLDTRLKNMYGISYNEATDEQVNKAREAVFGDALTALELIPAAKGATAVAKAGSAAIPSGIKADVVGQTKALLSGDTEFLKGTPTERSATQSLSAGFTGQNPPTYIPKGESIFLDAIPRDNTSMLRFREPIAEFTRKLTMTNSFPSKGMTGAEFLSLLEKNAESIPPSSYKEGLVDRDKRYTKEELLHAVTIGSENFLPQSLYYNIADLNAPPKFGTYQRQTEVGFTGYPRYPEDTSYFSIPILSRTVGNTFKANYQHFNPNTTAHVRGSFIDPLVGFEVNKTLSPEFKSIIGKDQPYLLVEEIQSDLLQKGYRKPKNSFDTAFDKAANEAMAGTQLTFQEAYGDVTNELKSIIKTLESKNIAMPEEPVRLQLPFRIGLTHPQFKNRRRTDFLEELKAPERGTVDGANLVNFEEIKDYIDKQGVNSTHIYQILNDIEKSANRSLSVSERSSSDLFKSVSFVGPSGKVYEDIIVKVPEPDKSRADSDGWLPDILVGFEDAKYKYIVDEESPAYSEFLADFDEYTKQFGLNFDDLMDAYNIEIDKYHDAIYKEMDSKKLSTDYGSFVKGMYEKFRKIRADEASLGDETNTALPPVRKNKQTVEEALKVLIAKADQEGVDKIVIPPANKIAEARRRTIDPSDKGDRFYRTYVTDLDKALKDLEKNYPVTVHRDVELPYKSKIFKPDGTNKRVLNVTNKGTIIDISKLREQFQVDKPRQFAEGGAVDMSLDRQMSFAFEEGGLRDDGMNQDPVSGNEVPSGSMAKEVRDDIPAQLSEGEYVVPADVVRYYGVKFFENLRTEAKMGLQSMEANGRIGGEPVPVGGPKAGENPLTPEEMEMLKQLGMSAGGSVRGFSQGGSVPDWVTPPPEGAMVTQVLTTLVNPITGETFTAPTGGYSINYNALQQAESPPKMADFDYFKSAPFQNSYERRPPGSTYFRTQAEIDADKGITTGPKDDEEGGFKNSEEYCASLGMNYDPETQMCVPIEKPKQTSSSDDDPRDPVSPPETKPWYEGISGDAEDSVSRYFGTGARIGAGIAGLALSASPLGLVGGAAGKYGVQGTNIAQARAEIALRTAAGDTEGAALLQSALDKQLKGSVGLAAADKFFENAFNSSGEKNVISALEAAGIDVPDSIKNKNFRGDPDFDGELMSYMSKYSKIINEKIFGRGASKVAPVTNQVTSNGGNEGTSSSVASTHEERYGLGGSRRRDDDGPSAAERHRKAVEATKSIEASTPKVETKTGSGSMADVSEKAGGAAKSYSDIAKKDDPYALLNKGGLMKKKKK